MQLLESFFLACDPYCDPGIYYRRHSCRRASGHIGCIKLLAGTHKEAGDPEGFPCRCICHYHSLRIFYPLAGAWDQLLGNYNGICIMSLGFMMSRCLSGIGVITFPKARTDGTVAEFSRNASEIAVRNVLIIDVCDPCSVDDMGGSDPGCSGSCQRTSGILVVSPYGFEIFWRDHRRSFRIFPLHLRGCDGTGACFWRRV